MPEEYEMLEQPADEEKLSQAQLKNQRNVANNARLASNIADAASKSANPYAKAAGTAIKAADKLTGGKASENIGKKINQLNKLSLGGRIAQSALNKMSENGTTDRIGQALNKKNNSAPVPTRIGGKGDAVAEGKDNSIFSRKEVEEQTSDGADVTLKATANFLKIGLIAFAPVMIVIIFLCPILAGSQTFIKVIGLGQADEVSSSTAEEKIGEHASEDLFNEETTDENSQEGAAGNITENITGYIYDEFIEDTIYREKFSKMNFIATTKSREFNEADLAELEDYYSGINNYKNGDYNMDTVYNFFFKLFYIQRHYKNSYKVDLDMPLLMSTLMVQSTEINDVFISNTKGYKINSSLIGGNGSKENNKYFKYDRDWSNHIISKDDSSHDIEILAQHMVSKVPYVESEKTCALSDVVDGQWCYIVDTDKYNEFLENFLEKKYFLDGEHKLNEGVTDSDVSVNSPDGTNPMAVEMVRVALNEYNNRNNFNAGLKYSQAYGFNARKEWCAAFVWYVSANTKYNGQSLYPDIIPFKSASTGVYMNYFNSSTKNNIKFYYNDSCKKLKGKNNTDLKYIPKPGDYIFFDWSAKFSYVGDKTQDHTAMVEKYEKGKVYTIEGNIGDKLVRKSYNASDCRIIGYGSWY